MLGAYSILPPSDTFPQAIAAARQALERDGSPAGARVTLAFALFLFEWKWDAAEAEFTRATQMRPGYATGHHWYGEFLMGRGRTDEALTALERARSPRLTRHRWSSPGSRRRWAAKTKRSACWMSPGWPAPTTLPIDDRPPRR
ncbi:MAG: hypothetical protein A3J29_10435 [Acidobacteria bacterium RIFCSPLOWO2_12_FULL_67_14b]|nr:MAG: hypothetical protein A3J29_10435 [Acidobacteria bacterium RIFCSPLOWO2_12_FULL_67_14b]